MYVKYLILLKTNFCAWYLVISLSYKEDIVCLEFTTAATVKDAQFSMHDKIKAY